MDRNRDVGEETIVVGDRVDLVVQMGQVFRALIEDRLDDGPFLVGIPSRKGVPMQVAQDDDIYLVFYRESGRYIAQMKVIALEKRGEIRYMWLLQKSIAQKNQRREAFRLPVSFDVQIYEYDEDKEKRFAFIADELQGSALESVKGRDISITGVSLLTRRQYGPDEKYLLSMHMDRTPAIVGGSSVTGSAKSLQLTAAVRRCIPWRTSNMFNTGMQFYGLKKTVSEDIAKYVLAEQQRQIKKRRPG